MAKLLALRQAIGNGVAYGDGGRRRDVESASGANGGCARGHDATGGAVILNVCFSRIHCSP
jgi:hypothetical protein